jgi:hypothetical protein
MYFPENHVLEIMPVDAGIDNDLVVLGINMVEMPGQKRSRIPPSSLDLGENWESNHDNYPVNLVNRKEGSLNFNRFMQAGIEVVLKSGPGQGKAMIIWDGQTKSVDLAAQNFGTQTILFHPQLKWSRLNSSWKVIVGTAIFAQWMGLISFFIFLFFIPTVFIFRDFGKIMLSFVSLLLLVPLINFIDPVIDFKDPGLESAVCALLQKQECSFRQHQLLTIATLDASGKKITDLSGIEHLKGLEKLNLLNNNINDVSALANLTRLTNLNLGGNAVQDVSTLAKLSRLEILNLRNNRVTDISVFSGLTQLTKLDLRGNSISNIAALGELSLLKSLNLRENPVEDVSPIGRLTRLRNLNLFGVQVSEKIELITNLDDLRKLNIRGCGINDLSPLAYLMTNGALQDDDRLGIRARIDIRDNPVSRDESDGYAELRPFWRNISERAPFQLPVFIELSDPVFSLSGGFYTDDFLLTLSSAEQDTAIHYTLEGSDPSETSPLYSQPIPITSQIGTPGNLAMNLQTFSQWQPPIGDRDRAAVVRARSFKSDGSHSAIVTQTYFVGPDLVGKYALPVVSLTTDPANLLDYEFGIYTPGRIHDLMGGLMGNYKMKGVEWERPASFEYYNEFQQQLANQNIGFRINGATTRSYPQKSLRLYASDIYDEEDDFINIYFPAHGSNFEGQMITSFKNLILRNSGNDQSFPFYRDNLLPILLSHTSQDVHMFRPVNVFLNGEYWGIYNLREYLNEEFLAARHELDPQKIVVLENNGQLLVGNKEDGKHYQEMLKFIIENEIKDQKNFDYLNTLMDMENFIDYQIGQIYSRNENWPFDNIKYWRYKTDTMQLMDLDGQDGRWRWLLHDLDTAFGVKGGAESAQFNTLVKAEGEFLFRSLLNNEQFRTDFINRFADHLNTSFLATRVISVIDAMESEIAHDLPAQLNRWVILNGSLDAWESNVQVMRDFAVKRPDYLRQHIIDRFGLPGTAELTITHNGSQGSVQINSIDLSNNTPGIEDDENWTGVYFEGIPIKLSATPKPGYEFVGWEGINKTTPSVSIILNENITIRAVFIPAQT